MIGDSVAPEPGASVAAALLFAISLGLLQADSERHPEVIAFVSVDRLRVVAPLFPGDTITVRETIQSVNPINIASGLLETSQEVLNQSGDTVLRYAAKFLVRRRPVE